MNGREIDFKGSSLTCITHLRCGKKWSTDKIERLERDRQLATTIIC